jgi:hypothetical protein
MLSPEELQLLTSDEKATIGNMEALFASKGWEFLLGWIKTNIETSTQRCLTAANWDQHLAARVQRGEFERWLNLEASFEAEYAAIAHNRLLQNLEAESADEAEHE